MFNAILLHLQHKESGWVLSDILFVEVSTAVHTPLAGCSFIDLPQCVRNIKAIINVKNSDNYCFAWSILSALYPQANRSGDVTRYFKYFNTLNFENITFPVQIKDIPIFERRNNISINVFGLHCDEKNSKQNMSDNPKKKCNRPFKLTGPLHHCIERKAIHVNLLYIEDDTKGHYCYIKDLAKLLVGQMTKHTSKIYICDGCLSRFQTPEKLKAHLNLQECSKQVTILPDPGKNVIQFVNSHKSVKLEFVIYADFETFMMPFDTAVPNAESKYIMNTDIHVPYSFSYKIKCSYDDSLNTLRIYRGKNCSETFVKMLIDDTKDIFTNHILQNRPMAPLTPDQVSKAKNATHCYMCGGEFSSNNNDISQRPVLDHSHSSSLFRGKVHSKCNLASRTPLLIPVIMHNLSSFDCHLFVKELAQSPKVKDIKVIGLTKEKYLALDVKLLISRNEISASKDSSKKKSIHRVYYVTIRFLDSFRFMSSSLTSLASYLDDNQFIETRRFFNSDSEFKLMKRKGIFCYEYVNSLEILDNTKELPSREEFYSSLTQDTVSEADYLHAENVWHTFNCKNLGDYSDLYLKSDVLLLTDVFEAFRTKCLDEYGLDPAWYLTAPGLSWDAMLKHTQIKLELLTDIEMLQFIKKSIRGGVAMVSHRHAIANNKYIAAKTGNDPTSTKKNSDGAIDNFTYAYDPDKDTSFLSYFDSNNLYGKSLSEHLPCSNFTWLTDAQIEQFDVMDICSQDGEIGYILECDIHYPNSLHEWHNCFPFLVENIVSPASNGKVKKLIPNFFDKERYVVHYKTLYQALKYGLILKKIHRILSFKQSKWIAPYIEQNTRRRQNSRNNFEKNLYKLLNNCIFGKSMESVEKRKDIRLLKRWDSNGKSKGASYYISNPRFKSFSIFDENLVAVEMQKQEIVYDKPIFIGFCVLEIAKYIMYDFHYGFIKQKYGNKATLLYTDTDSLIYRIFTDDIYVDIKENIDKFDTTNYDENNIYGIPRKNKAVPGLFKDETQGKVMLEFVGLRAKLYDYVYNKNTCIKKAKGVKNCVVKRLKHEEYKQCLFEKKNFLRSQTLFRSIKHVIHTQLVNKVCLSYNDDKRYILEDGIHTLAWGHYKISNKRVKQ